MANKKKIPAQRINAGKQLHILTEQEGFYHKRPSWTFAIADLKHDSWGMCCDRHIPTVHEILGKLSALEGQTWAEILTAGKGSGKGTKNHPIARDRIIKEAQDRLSALNIWHEEIYSLRIGGGERIWGVMQNGVFALIWYDPSHEIYPVAKKHT